MNLGNTEISDKVTVIVFKDNYAARTFQVPIQWISKLGICLGILLAATVVSSFLSIKYYRIASKSEPAHVQELEQELTDLRINLKNLENQGPETAPKALLPDLTRLAQNSATNTSTTDSSHTPLPGQILSKSPTEEALPIFSAFPHKLKSVSESQTPDPSHLPIKLQSTSIAWHGKSLHIRFALQYILPDHGNVEGKILLLARGPDSLWSYPKGTVNRVGSESLLAPEQGEFFSFSRYREVKAAFGPVASHETLQEVEIFLFHKDGHVLVYQKLSVPKPVQAEPETSSDAGESES
jgi:hypothetical protein